MATQSLRIPLLGACLSACDLLAPGGVTVHVDPDEYRQAAPDATLVTFVVTNHGGRTVRFQGCRGTGPIGLQVEQERNGRWLQVAGSNVRCAPPSFESLDLRAGEGYGGSYRCCSQAGSYRLHVYYRATPGEPGWDSTRSNRFEIR